MLIPASTCMRTSGISDSSRVKRVGYDVTERGVQCPGLDEPVGDGDVRVGPVAPACPHPPAVVVALGSSMTMSPTQLPDTRAFWRSLGAPGTDQGGVSDISSWPPDQTVAAPLSKVGTSAAVVQAYLYAIDRLGGSPVALGTDCNGFACLPGPRFGRPSVRLRRRDCQLADRNHLRSVP